MRPIALLALAALLAGCGTGARSAPSARASDAASTGVCPQTVMATLDTVLQRVYHEGVLSERTASAEHLIEYNAALRAAVEADDAAAATAAGRALIATGHMTNLRVVRSGRVLVSLGRAALAPLHGTIESAAGSPLATYLTSVWSDAGFSSETSGVAEGLIDIRAGERTVGGTLRLPPGRLPAEGVLTHDGTEYQYSSFAATAYPSGAVRIYLAKPLTAVAKLCGGDERETMIDTLKRVAELIYEGEAGPRTLVQVRRVQHNLPLLEAVAARNPQATAQAVAALLHHHLVRLRVTAGGKLLDDDGGPYVLAPVRAKLRYRGRQIGSIVLSIQDDEGYLRLTHRLAGLDVLMYMAPAPGTSQPRLVKNSLGPGVGGPSTVPASGPFSYHGREFEVFTVNATAFPSGPLTIRVLVPLPYT